MELVSIATFVTKLRNPSGRRGENQIVRFGSGAGPRLYSVCRKRKLVRVTSVRPSSPMPPIDSVTQVGSPANSSSYSGVRRNRTMRMHRLAGAAGRHGDVAPVLGSHLLQRFQRPDLLAELFAVADDLLGGHRRVEAPLLLFFPLDQSGHPVQRHAPVVADDPAAAVGVGQAGEDVRAAAGPDLGG